MSSSFVYIYRYVIMLRTTRSYMTMFYKFISYGKQTIENHTRQVEVAFVCSTLNGSL